VFSCFAGLCSLPVLLIGRAVGPSVAAFVPRSLDSEVCQTLVATWSHPVTRVLLLPRASYYVLVGSLDVLHVILPSARCTLGRAAIGVGAWSAGGVTILLLGGRNLSLVLFLSILGASGDPRDSKPRPHWWGPSSGPTNGRPPLEPAGRAHQELDARNVPRPSGGGDYRTVPGPRA